MNQARIATLLKRLTSEPSSKQVANPYREKACAKNLAAYLRGLCELPFSGQLLVGEAPGHRGCAVTGIPFTSERILANSEHPFVTSLRSSLAVSGDSAESTATIVWDYVSECDVVPAFWNIFPFHPHKIGKPDSNRTPTAPEVAAGCAYLELVLEVLGPVLVIAVGGKATKTIKRFFPDVELVSVPHPSYGHKQAFIDGLAAAGIRKRPASQ